jgi:nucleotide-binding universal stress UspA family protein
MMTPRTLLVPIDFSEPAEAALDYAVSLAAQLDAKVYLLNVVELHGAHFSDLGAALTVEMIDMIVGGNAAALERLADKHRASGRIGDVVLRTGDPRDLIVDVARELGADLIVMGTHGRHGFKRLILGSVAATLLRTAPCPVLTVHPPAPDIATRKPLPRTVEHGRTS